MPSGTCIIPRGPHIRSHACWLLSLAGLRRSEILGLRWTDLDAASGALVIERSVTPDASGRRGAPAGTKTDRGVRTLPLPPDIHAALRQLRKTQATRHGLAQARDGWICLDEHGQPMRPDRYSALWTQLCTADGVPVLPLHFARRTSVTRMRSMGVGDDVVAAWHGHDETTRRAVYSHPDAVELARAGRTLSEALGGKG